MAEKSGVEWTTASWGCWRGCYPSSVGCENCYARRDMNRYGMDFSTVTRAAAQTFNMPLRLKEPTEIFVTPWSDFWLPEADAWREEAFAIMRKTPHLYLIPTKRPQEMKERLPSDWEDDDFQTRLWPGVSVSTQADVDRLLPLAHYVPGHWWLSAEPLLEEIDISPYLPAVVGSDRWWPKTCAWGARLCGVVIGCESGPDARPCRMDWIRSLVQQCDDAQIPVMVKQASVNGKLIKMPPIDGKVRADLAWRPK